MSTSLLHPADPRVAPQARTMLLTFAVASWCSLVLGVDDVNILLVVTFAWTSTAALRLAAMPIPGDNPPSVWGRDFAVKAVIGLGIWIGLPVLRLAYPDWWLWHPLMLPGQVSATGATVALCWPLRPFWVRMPAAHPEQRGAPGGQVETLLLACSLFLVSGSPIFALFAVGTAGLRLFGLELRRSRPLEAPAEV